MPSVTLERGADSLALSTRNADPAIIIIAILLLAGVSAWSLWRAWRNISNARIIEDTPTSRARSAHQGYVELEGTGRLMDGPPIVAPLSGTACIWYRYKVEEQQVVHTRSGRRRQWVTVDQGTSSEVFWLEDSTGRIAIDPEGAEVRPMHSETWFSGAERRHSNGRLSLLLANFLTASVPPGHRRYTEERIHAGEPLYALGLLKNIGSHVDAPNTEEETRQLLVAWKRDQPALLARFDLNKDGRIDEKEWMLARAQARREVLKSQREHQAKSTDPVNLLTHPEDSRRPYLLSSCPQQQLVSRYRQHAWWLGLAFFAGGSAAIWLFNNRFV